MKLNAALAKTLLMAASIGIVIPVVAQSSSPNKKEGNASSPDGSQSPESAAPGEAAEPALPGAVVERSGGGFLSLTVEGGKFKLSFYDAKKKPAAPDAVRATTRWDPVNKAGQERSILNLSEDGQALVGNVFVRPPHIFRVYLSLLGEDGQSLESHVINFRG